jgi:hypothetical protein
VAEVDEAEVERLYSLPLDRFTAERDELAKRLRADKRRDEADAVKQLRKPSVAAWTVNRLARDRPRELKALLAAADRVRRSPGGAGDDLRSSVESLLGNARELLERERGSAPDAVLQAVARTLRAGAAGDDDQRRALERGVLAEELEPSGFEAMAGLSLDAAPKPAGTSSRTSNAAASRKASAERRKRVEDAKAALADARERARALRRESDQAERAAKRAREEADRAATEVDRAEQALADARDAA